MRQIEIPSAKNRPPSPREPVWGQAQPGGAVTAARRKPADDPHSKFLAGKIKIAENFGRPPPFAAAAGQRFSRTASMRRRLSEGFGLKETVLEENDDEVEKQQQRGKPAGSENGPEQKAKGTKPSVRVSDGDLWPPAPMDL